MTLEERNEVMKQKYYKSESVIKAKQNINLRNGVKYDAQLLQNVSEVYWK